MDGVRLTQYTRGGGCACKIPPGELEAMLATISDPGTDPARAMIVGTDSGDDGAVIRLDERTGLVATVDFFGPVVDDAYDFGRVAACNALSDVYAMGGTPLVAINLLAWPRDRLPMELAAEVLRGGADLAREASCYLGGGHSIDDDEPKYGMAVTGLVDVDHLIRLEDGAPGLPLCLTKPLGVGVLNNRHKATGEIFPQAIKMMTTLNRDASVAAIDARIRCGTDITGFGLLGHAYKLARASNLTVVIHAQAVPYLDGARQAARDGFISGGTHRNLTWIEPFTDFGATPRTERLLLADAQTSGGLLLAGEIPGAPIIGELRPRSDHAVIVQ